MTVLILTADSNPARNSQKSCLPTASEPAVSLFPTSVPVSEGDEILSGQPETATEGDEIGSTGGIRYLGSPPSGRRGGTQ